MDLRKLEIFLKVAESGSFSRAATQLYMAQPAVSIAVRKLEEELGTPLFDRSGRQALLTAEGRHLQERARPILLAIEDLKSSTGDMVGLLRGEITMACPSMLATYFLPDMLTGFLTLHPALRLSITQAGTERVEEMLLGDEIELGVITCDDRTTAGELEVIPLVKQKMVLCLGIDHPWRDRKRVRIADLQDLPMVVYESGYFIRTRFDQLCSAQGVKPDIRMQTNFLPLLVKMVKKGLGCTVGLEIMSQQEPELAGVPLSPAVGLHPALAKRRGRVISRANQAFLDWARSNVHPGAN